MTIAGVRMADERTASRHSEFSMPWNPIQETTSTRCRAEATLIPSPHRSPSPRRRLAPRREHPDGLHRPSLTAGSGAAVGGAACGTVWCADLGGQAPTGAHWREPPSSGGDHEQGAGPLCPRLRTCRKPALPGLGSTRLGRVSTARANPREHMRIDADGGVLS